MSVLTQEEWLHITSAAGLTGQDARDLFDWHADIDEVTSAVNSASIAAQTPIADSETVVVALVIPANTLEAGASYLIHAAGTQVGTNAANPLLKVRVGPTTLTGNIATSLTGITGANALPVEFEANITVRTVGASGTVLGSIRHMKTDGTTYDFTLRAVASSTVAIDTTVENRLEFTLNSGNAAVTYNIQTAYITKVA